MLELKLIHVSKILSDCMLLSQDRIDILAAGKFRINNTAFTIKGSFEGQSIKKMTQITPLGWAINMYILSFVLVRQDCL